MMTFHSEPEYDGTNFSRLRVRVTASGRLALFRSVQWLVNDRVRTYMRFVKWLE